MLDADELCFDPATRLRQLIGSREISPTELLEIFLARIERVNPTINAYCTVAYERARREAQEAEQMIRDGRSLGLLHGVPVSIKDLTATAGVRTTMGSRIFEHNVPAEDALVVQRIRAAGGIIIGKTNTPEFGCKGVTDNHLFGVTRNPWKLDRVAGGSSGGAAAAVAAGLGPLAQGTDLAGSVRIPAAACGVVGLKPSPGRIRRVTGVNAWNSMAVDGPLARTVLDTATLFQVMAGPDDRDPLSIPDTGEDFIGVCDAPLPPLRIAWSADLGFAPIEPEVARISREAASVFEHLGAVLDDAHPGFPELDDLIRRLTGPPRSVAFTRYLADWADVMDPLLIERMRMTEWMSADDYERLTHERTGIWRTVQTFFRRYDLFLTPTLSMAAFPIMNPYPPTEIAGVPTSSATAWFPYTFPFNLTGHPAITVPAGWTEEGLPVGLQIVGRLRAERLVLQAAAAFEKVRPWTDQRPPGPELK